MPYGLFANATLDAVRLTDHCAYASGEMGGVYKDSPGIALRRTVLMTADWMLTIDTWKDDKPRQIKWICHATSPFETRDNGYVSTVDRVSLIVLPVTEVKGKAEPSTVIASTSPAGGVKTQRGHHLLLQAEGPRWQVDHHRDQPRVA